MADPIQSFLDSYGQSDAAHIPHQARSQCCCGNVACVYLKHNQSALEGLEKDVSTAARLGKALLVRHESYIADSEREREAMTAQIGTLEAEKTALEKRNATVVEENRSLLDQLEAVNAAVSDSDAHVVNLQATLQSTQQELQRLTQLAARTESLERQLVDFEREQVNWQSSLEAKQESEKTAVRRWQKAERTLANLEEQIERIEQEAKKERERHAEIVDRMQRRHNVEKELGSAAGRLKSAAALKNGGRDRNEPNVVSHFVRDILQDNANLQMGIVELREMLNNSNEEVENLRKQVELHQPIEDDEKPGQPEQPERETARRDLNGELNRASSSELHVHHHYHAPPTPATPKAQPLRRPRKKRIGPFGSGFHTPPSRSSTPHASFSYGEPTSTATIMQQTAASVPQSVPMRNRNRWSTQSNQTFHSVAVTSMSGSPQSTTNRTSSIFDRVFSDAGHESSRPTTPDTEDPGSPVFPPSYSKRGPSAPFRVHTAPVVQRGGINVGASRKTLDSILSIEELPKLDEHDAPKQDDIPEEGNESEWENDHSTAADPISTPEPQFTITSPFSDELLNPLHDDSYYRPRQLRRAASHESVLSASGMDIHTVKSRPSQLLTPYAGRGMTSLAAITDTTTPATRPAAMSRPAADSKNLLSGMTTDPRQTSAKPGVGKKVGGWILGRWGATPEPNTNESPPATAKKPDMTPSMLSPSEMGPTKPQPTPKKPKMRPTGINQGGPLEGFFPEVKKLPTTPVVNSLDKEALESVLNGK